MKRPAPRKFVNRRTLLMCLLLLVGGAIINVAVAWGCVWRVRFTDSPSAIGRMNLKATTATFATFETLGASRVLPQFWNPADAADYYPQLAPPGWVKSTITKIDAAIAEGLLSGATLADFEYPIDAAGLPMRCLSCRWVEIWNLHDGIPLSDDQFDWVEQGRSALPLRPIWPGFAINTLFYAAILWGLFAAPFTLRRHSRIRRGLCPACAYPVGERPICTECGRPLSVPQLTGAEGVRQTR